MKAELAQDARAMLGEGPVWDQRSGRLHWVDIHAGLVHRFSPADGSDFVLDAGQPVSAVGLGADGGLVLAIRDGFGLVEAGSDRVGEVIEVEKEHTGNRMNDGRCDPAGRFWAGTMASRWEDEPCAGALYRLERTGGCLVATEILSGITVANGIDWAPDGRHMYYIDSATRRVDVFDFDTGDGTLRNRAVFAAVPAAEGLPDGLVVDADGGVWVALLGAGRLRRYSPSARIRPGNPAARVPRHQRCFRRRRPRGSLHHHRQHRLHSRQGQAAARREPVLLRAGTRRPASTSFQLGLIAGMQVMGMKPRRTGRRS